MDSTLTAVELVAVAKAVKDAAEKGARSSMVAGEYPVDVTVRITGTMKKGEDYDEQIVAKADPWTLLAVALSKLNGVTVDSIVREALTSNADLVDAIKVQANEAMGAIKAATVTRCTGKITTKLAVAKV